MNKLPTVRCPSCRSEHYDTTARDGQTCLRCTGQIAVGDRVKLGRDWPHYNLKSGDRGTVVAGFPPGGSASIQIHWDAKSTPDSNHWHYTHIAKVPMPNTHFTCSCGATDSFIENWTATNHSVIDWIDADTGKIHWTGDSELGENPTHVNYQCTHCGATYRKADFDPATRIASMLTDLDDLLGDDDDGEEEEEEEV